NIQFASRIEDSHEITYPGMKPHGHYCVPILLDDEVVGVLMLHLEEGHIPDPEEEATLTAVASGIALLIQRNQAKEEDEMRRRTLRSVYELALESGGSLRELCDTVAKSIAGLMGVPLVSIELLEGRTIKVLSMFLEGKLISPGEHPLEGHPCEKIYREKRALQFQGPLSELYPRISLFKEYELNTYLGVPVKNSWDEVIGFICVADKLGQAFQEEDLHILQIFARRLGNEFERESIQAQLFRSQKLEALGSLAGGIAHDFNNLLTVIQGFAELALMKLPEDHPVHRYLTEIHKASQKASILASQLLAFSRHKPARIAPLSLNQIITEMREMLTRTLGENISLHLELDPNLWTIKGDRSNVEQVIMNLVLNSRDAMPEGGDLLIRTENVSIDEMYAHSHPDARPGEFVCLSVQDTGTGMEKAVLERLFEPFFTTKEPGKGTGLGLSVVYGIVKAHDGWISVYSEPDKGSLFKIYLPAVLTEKELEGEETIIRAWAPRGYGQRILVVEDEEDVKEMVADVLRENGYTVFTASNAREALEIFEVEEGAIDLVFTDVILPDIHGPELVKRLMLRNPQLRVLFCSGYMQEHSEGREVQEKGLPFIQKPFSVLGMLQAVRNALESPPPSLE
ncbi:MAG: hypothetical protein DRI61_08420, partial [Chloroflexi bacterium]